MSPFIAMMIMREADKSLEAGQAKYRAYFVNTTLYLNFKEEVNTILDTEGYGDVIVNR